MKFGIRLSLALLLGACAAPAASSSSPAAAAPRANATDVIGSVDGIPVTRGELPSAVFKKLADMENEHLQREMHLTWVGFEDVIDFVLLTNEAKRRGISVDALRAAEIDAKATAAGDADSRAFYDDNADEIQVPYDVAAPYIKKQLDRQKKEELERAYLEQLRKNADIRYALPLPELPRLAIDVANAPAEGPEAARVTLVEFSDFECPYCSRARALVTELRELYPDTLRVVFRDFPLAQHPNAREAAEAAQCAHEQGKFWPYHHLLFDNQQALASAHLEKYAGDVALDAAKFASCMKSERPKAAVEASERLAKEYGVEGTPALFLNGMKLIGVMPLPLMKLLIDRELEKARGSGGG